MEKVKKKDYKKYRLCYNGEEYYLGDKVMYAHGGLYNKYGKMVSYAEKAEIVALDTRDEYPELDDYYSPAIIMLNRVTKNGAYLNDLAEHDGAVYKVYKKGAKKYNEWVLFSEIEKIKGAKSSEEVPIRKMYAIYAGMGGSFGGQTFRYFDSYENEDDALEDARAIAIEEYKSCEGLHGILSQEECENGGYIYENEIDCWTEYSADEVSYEDIISISKYECLDLDCICAALNKLNICNKIKAMEAK